MAVRAELHLDQGVEVSKTGPYPSRLRNRMDGDSGLLVDGPHFRLHYWRCGSGADFPALKPGDALVIPFSGIVSVDGEDLAVGECGLVSEPCNSDLVGDALLLIAQPV